VYLRIVGKKARTYPPNSVYLAAPWHEQLDLPGVKEGNNMFGSRSADLIAQGAKPEDHRRAEEFIRRVFHVHGG